MSEGSSFAAFHVNFSENEHLHSFNRHDKHGPVSGWHRSPELVWCGLASPMSCNGYLSHTHPSGGFHTPSQVTCWIFGLFLGGINGFFTKPTKGSTFCRGVVAATKLISDLGVTRTPRLPLRGRRGCHFAHLGGRCCGRGCEGSGCEPASWPDIADLLIVSLPGFPSCEPQAKPGQMKVCQGQSQPELLADCSWLWVRHSKTRFC